MPSTTKNNQAFFSVKPILISWILIRHSQPLTFLKAFFLVKKVYTCTLYKEDSRQSPLSLWPWLFKIPYIFWFWFLILFAWF